MPRFFFHIWTDRGLIVDENGSEYPDLKAAKDDAPVRLREFTANGLRANSSSKVQRIEITDHTGQSVMTISTKDALGEPR